MREPKKIALEVGERFGVLQLLPEKASFINMKLLRVLREDLLLSTEERDAIEMVANEDGNITWNGEKAKECIKEVGFDPKAFVMVMEALQKLDKEEALEPKHYTLYEKFVEVPEKDDEKVVKLPQ